MDNHALPVPPQPARPTCPYLGTEAEARAAGPAVDYPSFENRCWAGERPMPLLLTDQATLCLCSGFRQCPRFIAARAARHPSHPAAGIPFETQAPLSNEDPISHALHELESEIKASSAARARSRQRWGWIGAGLIFMSSLLCGGVFAGYIGWQLVNRDLLVAEPGSVATLNQGQPAVQPQLYLIVTATSESPAPGQAQAPPAQPQAFPQAVTPTPILVNPNPAPESQGGLLPLPGVEAAQAASPAAAAPPNIQLEIPTRRPTPVLDIPTSTPVPTETAGPTATPTPIPIFGPPIVLFSARDTALKKGDCTLVTWNVENVRAVYYENIGVDGQGEREECMGDRVEDYVLTVMLADGSMRNFTTTVDYIPPTSTPEPQPTATEYVAPTPTWTPPLPTATPTPAVRYGVRLELTGSDERSCSRGAECEIELRLTNTGDALDDITLYFTEAASWPRTLCRVDGVCSGDRLAVAGVGPGNSALIVLRVAVPVDAEAGPMTYRLRGQSQGNGDVQSGQVSVQIHAE